jgi:membrane protein DedA with SNARE-associated domain
VEESLHLAINWVVETVAHWGYTGIFLMMFIESSFVPFPSEVAMIPAGYLASQERMNAGLAILAGVGGSMGGALLNYQLALHLGLPVLERIGKYFFLKPESFEAAEAYFENHGEVTTFVGRLIPGIRQLISVPAGLARMNLPRFCLYTSLGAGMWSTILVGVGWVAGEKEELWRPLLKEVTLGALLALLVLIVVYLVLHHRKKSST